MEDQLHFNRIVTSSNSVRKVQPPKIFQDLDLHGPVQFPYVRSAQFCTKADVSRVGLGRT